MAAFTDNRSAVLPAVIVGLCLLIELGTFAFELR